MGFTQEATIQDRRMGGPYKMSKVSESQRVTELWAGLMEEVRQDPGRRGWTGFQWKGGWVTLVEGTAW